MLLAIGPGIASLQDYTMTTEAASIRVTQNQGDTLDTFKCITADRLSSYTIAAEDDIVWTNEHDSHGFPGVNLLVNPGFLGTFVSGVAPSWTFSNSGVAGATAAAYTGGCPAGAQQGQSLTLANVASGTQFILSQNITLPRDENNNLITSPGYCPSIYVLTPTVMSGVGNLTIAVNWLNASNGTISSNTYAAAFPTYVSSWVRMSGGSGNYGIVFSSPWVPPSGAVSVTFEVFFSTTSATNSGQVVFSAPQFEPCTFANYRSNDFSISPYFNSAMSLTSTAASTLVDQLFINYGPTGTTFSAVTTPTLNGHSQKIAISNVAINSNAISVAQDLMHHADYTYTVTATYQVTTALTGGTYVQLGVTLPNDSANVHTSTNLAISSTWQVLQLTYGPGASSNNKFTSSTGSVAKLYFGIVANSSATNAGAVVLASLTVAAVPSTRATAYTKALTFGQYPTPYCGQLVSGCYQDGITGLYYRQQRYFGGLVRNVLYNYSVSAERVLEIDAVEYGILLNEAPATLLIQKQADNLAIKAAGDYAKNLGFLAGVDYTSYVQNIITVDAMLFNWQTTRDVVAKISDHAVAAFWMDPHKRLHYGPALATSAPFGISDTPDLKTTYPAEMLRVQSDSTNTLTSPVIEGSTQISAPQTITYNGYNTTSTAGITAGNVYTSISVNAVTNSIIGGTVLALAQGGNTINVTTNGTTAANATSIAVLSFTATYTFTSGFTVNGVGFIVNNSNPIAQVDSATVGGAAQTIGIASVNTYSQGYTALIDVQAGILYFNSSPVNGSGNVVIVYRYAAPVIVRLHAPLVESSTGTVRRRIHHHITETTISSQQSAIDRANAELSVASKPKAVGEIVLRSPYAPFDNSLSVGQAIQVTFSKAGLNKVLYQIQQIDTTVQGNNKFVRTLKIGYYRPDFVVYMAQAKRQQNFSDSNTSGTVLQDVLSTQDAWVLNDSFVFTVNNIGVWGVNASAGVWGPSAGTVKVWG